MVKKKNRKSCIGFFPSKKTVTIKLHLSENLTTFQNQLKNRKLLPAEKFGNNLDFDKGSKRKPPSDISRQFY